MKIISYIAFNQNKDENVEFSTVKMDWLEARSNAIELAEKWKNESDLSNKYSGIRLTMNYGIIDDPKNNFNLDILTGNRMHSPEIVEVLWNEASLLKDMGYNYESAIIEFDEKQHATLNEKHITLYYFTA